MSDRFDRNERLFGAAGQKALRAATVTVIGVGGLGTHVVQQLALLGVGALRLVDSEDLDVTNRNRYVGARHDDPIPGTPKVDIGARIVRDIDPGIAVTTVAKSLLSAEAFTAVKQADFVFSCVDSDGIRLVLVELCAAYSKPLFDLATDVPPRAPGDPLRYGGRVVFANGQCCPLCLDQLEIAEAQLELAGPNARAERDQLYGIDRRDLADDVGPAVVSMNGVVASLAVTEFMVEVTGLRRANHMVTYRGHHGGVSVANDAPAPGCYYCTRVRGRGGAADVERYIR
jgi:hypothetical protein